MRGRNNVKLIETDEDYECNHKTDADGRFSFTRMVPGEVPMTKRNVHEHKKKNSDAIAAEKEHERAIANCIEHKVRLKKLCTKRFKIGHK